ncbi:MAG: DUF2817 domain-containing protein [Nocardioidaceae bacterium]|nr:DUF2817 domain-containing protein [Nocardioidaceae bacterium]
MTGRTPGKRLLVLVLAPVLLAATGLALLPGGGAHAAPAGRAAQIRISRVIGHSVKGRAIHAYYRGTKGAQHVLLLIGQMHGDEHAGPHTANWVRANIHPKPGSGVWVVPTMNPDGNARNTRQNAHGVDLNRNWPTSGWRHTPRGSVTYGGPKPASEPEVRAMMRFLRAIKPDYVASLHQALHAIGREGDKPGWLRRLHRNLGLPVRDLGVGNPKGTVSPTMTAWYDKRFLKYGVATTIEYGAHPSHHWVTVHAGRGIAMAARVV